MTKIIVTTPEELNQIVADAVHQAMQGFINSITPKEKVLPIRIKEAAEILSMSTGGLYNIISEVPHHKRNGKLYFFEEELIDYIRKKKP